jgi:hypothetical protein
MTSRVIRHVAEMKTGDLKETDEASVCMQHAHSRSQNLFEGRLQPFDLGEPHQER